MVTLLIAALRSHWRELVQELTDPYRPELHYMRGPGPKARAKRGAGTSAASLPPT
jgi:hypothetical protein